MIGIEEGRFQQYNVGYCMYSPIFVYCHCVYHYCNTATVYPHKTQLTHNLMLIHK